MENKNPKSFDDKLFNKLSNKFFDTKEKKEDINNYKSNKDKEILNKNDSKINFSDFTYSSNEKEREYYNYNFSEVNLEEFFKKKNENIEKGNLFDYYLLDIDDKEENLLDDYDFKKNKKDYEDEELEIEKLKMAFEIEKSSLKEEENLDEMSIIYRIKKNKNFQKVKLFGYKFVKENKKIVN